MTQTPNPTAPLRPAPSRGSGLPWVSDSPIDAAGIARLVGSQFPALAPASAAYLDEGWDSTVFEVNGTWIFRFPKRAEAEACHDVEWALLPVLAERLPLPVPLPCLRGAAADGYPFRFIGYRKLAGTPAIDLPLDAVDLDACGRRLGEFLTALHAFPVDEARALGVPEPPPEDLFARWRGRIVERLADMAPHLPPALLARTRAFLAGPAPAAWHGPPRLVHYDLGDAHFLVNRATRRLAGVLDWGDVRIGDAAVDFAGLAQWLGRPLVRAALRSYRGGTVDEAFLARADAVAAFSAFSTLWYGARAPRPAYVASGLRSLDLVLPP